MCLPALANLRWFYLQPTHSYCHLHTPCHEDHVPRNKSFKTWRFICTWNRSCWWWWHPKTRNSHRIIILSALCYPNPNSRNQNQELTDEYFLILAFCHEHFHAYPRRIFACCEQGTCWPRKSLASVFLQNWKSEFFFISKQQPTLLCNGLVSYSTKKWIRLFGVSNTEQTSKTCLLAVFPLASRH